MSLSFSILGSGSAGNSTLLQLHGPIRSRRILIDCGLSPRETARRLESLNVHPADITDIILTHLDRDHFYPSWAKAAPRHAIRIHMSRRQRSRAMRELLGFHMVELFDDSIALGEATHISAIPFPHDQLGTVGFVIEHENVRLGYATDLGALPDALFDHFTDLDALALESNYDRAMQIASPRPGYLKQRIMGGQGHLSNEQALEAAHRIASHSTLQHLALLHLSRQCNCPDLVAAMYRKRAPHLAARLTIARQDAPTRLLYVNGGTEGVRIDGSPVHAQHSLFG